MILIAGPCVIEGADITKAIANELAEFNESEGIEFYFKASFDKANRTSLDSFRGPGLEEGLKILDEVKKEFGFKILTDIHESNQAKIVSEVADVIQIPAFLSRQTDLLVASAKTSSIINIKKGQFLSANDMKNSILKVLKTRNKDEINHKISKISGVWVTERGNIFGYNNLVVDMRNLVILKEFAPTIFDATHSVQTPGGLGNCSGGDAKFVPYLARAAASVGVDGFFFETHIDPSKALCDGKNMIDIKNLKILIQELKEIQKIKRG